VTADFFRIVNYKQLHVSDHVAGRLKFKTDESSSAPCLSAAAITYFNIGNRIVDYRNSRYNAGASLHTHVEQSEAKGDMNRLRKIFCG